MVQLSIRQLLQILLYFLAASIHIIPTGIRNNSDLIQRQPHLTAMLQSNSSKIILIVREKNKHHLLLTRQIHSVQCIGCRVVLLLQTQVHEAALQVCLGFHLVLLLLVYGIARGIVFVFNHLLGLYDYYYTYMWCVSLFISSQMGKCISSSS